MAQAQDRDSQSEGAADGLRDYISAQVGGSSNLQVPASNEDLPVPRAADGTVPYRYQTTEANRFLGKMYAAMTCSQRSSADA